LRRFFKSAAFPILLVVILAFIAQRLISDQGADKTAVSDRRIVPSFQPQVLNNPQLKSRSELVDAPYNDYLVPNFKTLKNPLVRQALAVSTDKSGYITSQGGQTYGRPAQTLVNPSVLGYKDFNAFNAPDAGDPAKAKQLLTQAGVKMPYPINFTYSGGTPTSQKMAAALKSGWEKAGFKVTLNELTDTYYDVIQNPSNATKYDVTWASWGADWPSRPPSSRRCSTAGSTCPPPPTARTTATTTTRP